MKRLPPRFESLLRELVQAARDCFSTELTGVYLHGSAATGCFNPDKSDLDVIVVTDCAPTDESKLRFMQSVFALDKAAPAKGLEISVVQKCYCKPFVYPTPFELHYSRAHADRYVADPSGYVATMKGIDKDLAAHFTVINENGVALFGESVSSVFGKVPTAYFADSILTDVENARADISSEPVYVVLNLCRVAAYLNDGKILSKKEGGEWGLTHLPPKYDELISDILHCYATSAVPTANERELIDFADFMCEKIRSGRTTRSDLPF